MRCQRCGFELEPGQTFCSMCGTEQSRAIKKKKWSPKSILWFIKVVSKSHFKLWITFFVSLIAAIIVFNVLPMDSPITISSLSLSVILIGYEIFYILIGYKNPNATKTKAYKIRYRTCFILAILLLVISLFLDFPSFSTSMHRFIINCRKWG